MSIFNGNASPFTEDNSLYERNSLSGGLGMIPGLNLPISVVPGGGSGGGNGSGNGFDINALLKQFGTGSQSKKEAPWYETLLNTGLKVWDKYQGYKDSKEQADYNEKMLKLMEASTSNSVRVDASDAAPYLKDPRSGLSDPNTNQAQMAQALAMQAMQQESAKNEEERKRREQAAKDSSENTKTILYVAGGGVALIAVLLIGMKMMKK